MHGVVSLLDTAFYVQVEDLWKALENQCGLRGIRVTPYPHFSWQISEEYNWDAMPNILLDITRDLEPFTIRTSGLGIFSGENPVIYIPVIRTGKLNNIHKKIWDGLLSISEQPSFYYAPQNWMPHISLAYKDVSKENIDCALGLLAPNNLNWQVEIDNISVIYEPENSIGKLRDQYFLQR